MKRALVLCMAVVLMAGCGQRTESDGAHSIFRFNLSAPLTSLDPAFASDQPNSWGCLQLYNGLVQLDAQLQIVPSIAASWDISEDQLTYTFHLRKDVYFHDDPCFTNSKGRQVNAGDFVFAFERLANPATAARGYWVFQNIVDTVQGFRAINDSTLTIRLLRPFSPFLQRLAMPYCSVVPAEAVEHYGKEFRSHPVGTGPFTFVKWMEGNMLILHRNERYFEKDADGQALPYLDAVNIRFINNKSTEFLKFMNGELDFVSDIDVSLKDQILTRDGKLQQRYASTFNLLKGPYLNVEYLSVLMDDKAKVMEESPLVYPEVRKAINYAFNRSEMLLFLRNNRGLPATGGIVPPSLYTDPLDKNFGYYYNPDTAKALLEQAGFPGGVGLPELLLHTTAEYQDYATYLKDKLEDIGLAIRIETVDPRVLREMRVNEETAFFRSSWIADYSDPESYLQMFYSVNGAPPNYTRYANPDFDRLYEQAVAEEDPGERNALYRTMDSLMMQDSPIIPLYYDEVYRFTRKNVSGLEPDALNLLQLKRVRFTH